jgi:DNA-binding protein HU-beta
MSTTLTKDQLVNAVAEKSAAPVAQIHDVIDATLTVITEALAVKRKVELRQFGIFRPVLRAARKGRDPRDTTRVFDVPAKWAVRFKPSAVLNKVLNPTAEAAASPPAPTP